MGVLKEAFNMVARIHSRAATLKRGGTPNLYTPIRIVPSNYFRFLAGPSGTVSHGREFIIPVDTMTGTKTQLIKRVHAPLSDTFMLSYDGHNSAVIDAVAGTNADVQTAIRGITADLADITVTGDFTAGFTVLFLGVPVPLVLQYVPAMGDGAGDFTVVESAPVPWTVIMKRGDKIVDPLLGHMAIDEIVEIVDIGGDIMGYRVKSE